MTLLQVGTCHPYFQTLASGAQYSLSPSLHPYAMTKRSLIYSLLASPLWALLEHGHADQLSLDDDWLYLESSRPNRYQFSTSQLRISNVHSEATDGFRGETFTRIIGLLTSVSVSVPGVSQGQSGWGWRPSHLLLSHLTCVLPLI